MRQNSQLLLAAVPLNGGTVKVTADGVNIGGSASAPIIAVAYHESYAGIGVLMGVLGAAIGNFLGLGMGAILHLMA